MWGKRLSKNHKISISKANKGKKISKQTKEKIADAQKIPVLQFSSDSKTLINEWDSVKDASVALKINNSTIGLCCRGIRKTSGGFVWKYAHEYNISFEKK